MGILSSSLSAAWLRVVAVLAALAMAIAGLAIAAPAAQADGLPPTLSTDLPDYNPGATVNLAGEHWAPGLPIHIRVDDNVGAGWYLDSDPDPEASGDGTLEYAFRLPFDVIALYTAQATQVQADGSVLRASVTFTDNAGGNLDQCANGKAGTPIVTCNGAQWQNGNLNEQNSQWKEGDSVPYRLVLTGLPTTETTHTVVIGWDLTESGNWAYDYLTTYNRTNTAAYPCSGVTNCNGTAVEANIQPDTFVAANKTNPNFSQIPGKMSAFGKNGTTISALSTQYIDDPQVGPLTSADLNGTSERRMEISITTDSDTVVLAWAGHIATRADWGAATAVADINGSPYHMRFIDLNGKGGNQDRSLKASSVIFPAKITVIKETTPDGATQQFGFTASTGLSPTSFTLTDNGTPRVFDNITNFTSYTITEGTQPGWTLTGLNCTVEFPNGGTKTESLANRSAVLNIKEAEYWTCTFTNQANPQALTVSKTFTPTYTRTYDYNISKSVDKTTVTIADDESATFNYTVNATKSFVDSNFGGSGTITVSNPNAGDVTGVTITDTTSNGLTCAVANGTNRTIQGSGSITLNYTCTPVSTKPAAGTNTATATWSTQTVNGVSLAGGTATGTAPAAWNGDPTTIANQSVTVTDDNATPGNTADDVVLGTMAYTDPSPKAFTYSQTYGGVGGTCTDYTNTASLSNGKTADATVEVCVGLDLSVSKTVVPSFGRDYDWTIGKKVDEDLFEVPAGTDVTANYTVTVDKTFRDSGFTAKGVITVSNPNDFQAVTVDITDAIVGGASCTVTGGNDVVVPKAANGVAGTATASYECSLPNGDTVTNRATATWDAAAAHTPSGSDTFDAQVSFAGVTPTITDGTISVYDDKTNPASPVLLGTVSYTETTPKDFPYPLTFTAPNGTCVDYDNTAWFTIGGVKQLEADATVKVCGAVAPSANKLGTGTFDSAYTWDIAKTAGAKQTVPAGTDPIEVTYTVTVEQTGYSESDASAEGTITVKNANDWQGIAVDIEDSMGIDSSCLVEGVTTYSVTVPQSDEVTVDWVCTFSSAPSTSSVENVATVTWDKDVAHTATASTTAKADIAFTVGTQTDRTVEVTDTFNLGSETVLGSVTGVASSDSTKWTEETYDLTFEVTPTAGTCTKYPNVAELSIGDKADATAEVCVALDPTVSKTAKGSYDEAFTWKVEKTVTPATKTAPAGSTVGFDYTVTASQTGYAQTGAEASGTITLTNPNDFQAIEVELSETLPGADCVVSQDGEKITDLTFMLAADATVSLTYACEYEAVPDDKSVTNTAGITWDQKAASTPSGSDSDEIQFVLALDASKDASITVKDDFDESGSNASGALALGTVTGVRTFDPAITAYASRSWTYTQNVTAPSGTCASYDNLASIFGDDPATPLDTDAETIEVCGAADVKVSKTASGTYDRAFEWEILKSVDQPESQNLPAGTEVDAEYTVTVNQTGYSESGAEATGTITVENPNDFDTVTVSLSDVLPGFTCTIYDATKTAVTSVLLGKDGSATDTAELTYTCTASSVPADKELTNTVTASWSPTDLDSPKQSQDATAEFTLALDGSTDENVVAYDAFDGAAGEKILELAGVVTFDKNEYASDSATYKRTVTAPEGTCRTWPNTAKVFGDDAEQALDTAEESIRICGGVDLTAVKDGSGSYDSTYVWTVDKTAGAKQTVPAGTDPITVTYEVTVEQTGYSESGASASGTITVSNANDWQDIEVAISDSMGAGSSCTVEEELSHEVTVPKSGSVIVDWSCTFDPAPSSRSIENVATITWDKTAAATANGSATAKAQIAFALDGTKDATITVTDTFNGGTPVELDKLTGVASADPAEWVSEVYNLSYEVEPTSGSCTKYPNLVELSNGPKDDATAEVCVAVDPTIKKTAEGSYDETYTWKVEKTATPLEQTVPAGTDASFTYGVKASQTGYTQTGAVASGTITITNPNDFQAIEVNLSEDLPDAVCDVFVEGEKIVSNTGTIPAGGTVELTYECEYGTVPADKTVTNTAGITWDKAKYSTPTGSASDPVEFTLVLDQSTDKVITVTDDFDNTGSNGSGNPVLGTVTGEATFESTEYASGSWGYGQTVTAPSGTCLEFDNLAVITGDKDVELDRDTQTIKVCGAADVKVSKTAEGIYDNAFEWDITKDVDQPESQTIPAGTTVDAEYTVTVKQTGYTESNAEAAGTITVENPNDFDSVTVSLSDAIDGGDFTCYVLDKDDKPVTAVLLAAGEKLELRYECESTVVPSDKDLTNTVTASWSETDLDSPAQEATGTAKFSLTLDDSTDASVVVTDDFDGTGEVEIFTVDGIATFDADDYAAGSQTYTRSVEAPSGECRTWPNTAYVYGDDAENPLGTAQASFEVCGGVDLTVTKTAAPSFTRTYLWDITKAVDKTYVQIPSGTATFTYTIDAFQTGVADSAWKVTGTITVTNPNTFQDVSVDVSDAISNGGTCTVEGKATHTVTVLAGKTATASYECTYPTTGPLTKTGTNTATITWDKAAAGTATGSDTGTASADFGAPTTTVNKTITVKDTFDGGSPVTLGTVTGTDTEPWASREFTYSKTVNAPAAGVCRTYNNTAVIVETGDSASQSVQVCGPDPLGSRTIGFWQNKNGQGIIKAGLAPNGVCASGTWLRQYAPYQDLSATASCATVASYVYTVIKAASAGGPTMNPMLKAQMLATALDVYFSDPALGGNKLKAPQPIGPRVIDLTQICKTLGTSCSGSLYDVSSAFGGSPKTVFQMLTYAASKSNVGGTVWYGNVKSTQGKAKDAFDAINNDQVIVIG